MTNDNKDMNPLEQNQRLRDTAFSVPDDYFESLGAALKEIKHEESLNLSKDTPFSAPNNYIDNLDSTLKSIPSKQNSFSWTKASGIAAAIAILVCLMLFNVNNKFDDNNTIASTTINNTNTDSNNGLDEEELIHNYLAENYIDELSIDELINELSYPVEDENEDSKTEEIKSETGPSIDISEIDTEDIEEYLDENYELDELIENY